MTLKQLICAHRDSVVRTTIGPRHKDGPFPVGPSPFIPQDHV